LRYNNERNMSALLMGCPRAPFVQQPVILKP